MRLILIFSILFVYSLAQNTVIINSDKFKFKDFQVGYFINDKKKVDFKDIQDIQFSQGKNSDTLGAEVKDTWIKIKLFNSTKDIQNVFLHQDIAYTFYSIKYYEVNEKGNLLNKQTLNPFDTKNSELYGADAIYKLTLKPQENKTLYIRQHTLAYHFYNFSIFSEKESKEYLVYEKVDGILFVGLLLALAIYNMFIFISSRYKEYLYYSLYLFSATAWIFYMYGSLAHYMHIYGDIAIRFNFGLMFTPVFIALFVQTIFKTKNEYKTEHKFLNSVIILLILNFIYALINFGHALELLSLSLNYALIIFLFISISIYKKGNKIVKIFLLAHTSYLLFTLYALMFYTGNVPFSYISSHGIGIGIVIEALMLSYLVSYKFKIMEEEKEVQRELKQKAIEEQYKTQRQFLEQLEIAQLANLNSEKLKDLNKELKNISITDKLTSLYNRVKLDESLEYHLNYSQRYNETFGVIMVDIDFFKSINDSFGHQTGDIVLVEFANILKANVRQTDIVGRWGGEEFMIICPKSNLEDTKVIAKKIKEEIENFEFTTVKNKTASFGISTFKNSDTLSDIVHRADKALYQAKESGRNKICAN
ncbi:MAG: diguanylate cyclase [Poseidonibacter sp.]|uniref:sensor domain-containing diguanylate cyclase n=1 Tax=Poseidonibacter sp. TaxID=2321188 RepID=UPI00359D504C